MEKPSVEQIKQIVRNLTESDDPVVHKATVEKYVPILTPPTSFTQNAAFVHPIVDVKPAPHSIDTLKQVYAVYKVLTRKIEIHFTHVTIDADNTRAVIELEEDVNFVLLPFGFARIRGVKFMTVLDLVQSQQDDNGVLYLSLSVPLSPPGPFPPLHAASGIVTDGIMQTADGGIDIIPVDAAIKSFPFGFVYGWWRGVCTLTGSVVGSGLQMSGLWATA
ncbi:hypothetical protein HO133_000813 [Letharia lupina]|uniref:SigF-like NTF2-like domain-containing protein n=1 Tax=Letharia lupina TaxID=560253 RepID=A0A8H6CFT3_9LECA|nr:uncharacterized protein HO133_000813 [Letharia lupina]KAF6222765.1 hypothetical protein HO133_000813 [Letharia lupina]